MSAVVSAVVSIAALDKCGEKFERTGDFQQLLTLRYNVWAQIETFGSCTTEITKENVTGGCTEGSGHYSL